MAEAALPIPVEARVPQLKRSLGLTDVALFYVIAGSNLQWVATAANAGPSSLPLWIGGCAVMFLPLALVVIVLSSRYPDEGGMYIWSKRAFGPFAGFMTGWTYWTSNLPYFPALLYFTAGNALFISGGSGGTLATSAPYFIIVSIAGLLFGTIVNVLGLDVGKWLNNAGAISRWSVTLLLIGLGALAWSRFGPATHVDVQTMRPGFQLKDIIFWSVIVFAWTGPESLPLMAGEVKNPRRIIPLGLLIAAPAIAVIYIAGTVAVLAALTPSAVNTTAGVMQAIARVANATGWNALTPFAALLVTVSCLGSVGAWLAAVARIPFVAGIDRYLPKAFGRIDPRWGSPVVALVTQAAISAIFIFLGQGGASVRSAYNTLVSSTVIITLIPFLFLFASALVLRQDPRQRNALRLPGGQLTVALAACVGLAVTLFAIVLGFFPADTEPDKLGAVLRVVGLTVLMVGSGVVVYLIGSRRARRAPSL